MSIYDAEDLRLGDILRKNRVTAVRITATMDELYALAMNQNFVPVTYDEDIFIF